MDRLICLFRGWRQAFDNDDGENLLVVWHDKLGVHYTGPSAWRDARAHKVQS